MAQTTFANGRGIAHRGSGGRSTVFPDVCWTPVGQYRIPIPYPNTGRSADTVQGPATVRTDGEMPMVKRALYSRSTGDEPGRYGGILSRVNKDVCEFLSYSFDVKLEGRNACRLGDPLYHNRKNVMG